jgi:transcriptional regulator with XRE-family HTH domain
MPPEREAITFPMVNGDVDMDDGSETGSGAPAKSERTLELALGVQIRLFRRQHDLSVSDLAGAAGISTGMLSKIENGQISPSLSTLQAIATALGTSISSLFSTFEDRQDCSFVRAKQGAIIERRGTKSGHVYELLGHALSGPITAEPFLITLQKDAAPHTSFQHSGIEFIYMLSGEVVYQHAGKLYHLRTGDSLLFDSSALHGPKDLVKGPIRYLSVIMYPKTS